MKIFIEKGKAEGILNCLLGETDSFMKSHGVVLSPGEYRELKGRFNEIMTEWLTDGKLMSVPEKGSHDLEITCECTMRQAYRITADNNMYELIGEGDISPIKGLFDRTVTDCLLGSGDIETDYAVYDLDRDKQIIDWN